MRCLVAALVLCLSACSPGVDEQLAAAHELDLDGKYAEAILIYNNVLKEDSTNISVLLDRAMDRGLLDDKQGNVEDLKRVLAIDPQNILALFNIGVTYGSLEKYPAAIDAFGKAIRSKGIDEGQPLIMEMADDDPYDVPFADIRLERGIAYAMSDSLRRAYYDLTYCIDQRHKLNESYYYRGRVHLKGGNLEAACDDLAKAADLSNKFAAELMLEYCNHSN
jgi:tetratricopeptide (TPR) repeat protein